MSNTSHSFGSEPMPRRSETLTLGSSPIVLVGSDRRIINFEETRFRLHAFGLQNELKLLAAELASELDVALSTLDQLSAKSESSLKDGIFCAFDFLDVKVRREGGFLRVRWIPFAVFLNGDRVFSLHATYSDAGCRLSGLTMRRDGEDEFTHCRTTKSALKVGRSFLRTYVSQGKS